MHLAFVGNSGVAVMAVSRAPEILYVQIDTRIVDLSENRDELLMLETYR